MSLTTAYDLADALYKLAPWEWMIERQLIAIRDPETDRIDHISIMGREGTHHCLALYLGPESRQRFNLIQDAEYKGIQLAEQDNLSLILDSPQLQISFEPRSELSSSELATIKKLGRKYRGTNWPVFRSFKPGHVPSATDPEETQWLATAIAQTLEVAPTLRPESADTARPAADGGLEGICREQIDDEWTTTWIPDNDRLPDFPTPNPDPALIEKVLSHDRSIAIECHFQLVPNPIGKNREESIFPYLLICVLPESEMILGVELFSVEKQSHTQLIDSVPNAFLQLCQNRSCRPSVIRTDSAMTAALLSPTAKALSIPCEVHPYLPAMAKALDSMRDSLF